MAPSPIKVRHPWSILRVCKTIRSHTKRDFCAKIEDATDRPKYRMIDESRLVPPPIGEIGELHTGKLVYVRTRNGSRRSKLLSMSEDYQTLQNELNQLGGSYKNKTKFKGLENMIEKQEMLEKRNINKNRKKRLINPYENPRPSTSACSDTVERSKPKSINHFNDSYNVSSNLINISQSFIQDRLHTRKESGARSNNRNILVRPTSTSGEESYDVSSEQVDSDKELKNNANNRQFPRNSSVVRNRQPIEDVNLELDDREGTPRTVRRMKRRRETSDSHESSDTTCKRNINKNRKKRLINPYENPKPSTSACSDTVERSKPKSINHFNDSYNVSSNLINISQSFIQDRLHTRKESGARSNNRNILVRPTSTSGEESYDVTSEQDYSDKERENNANNRQFPRNSSVVRNRQPIEDVNLKLDDREGTPRTVRRMKRRSISHESSDTVRIGPGRTEVSKYIINQLDWTSYTVATSKLMMAVFPRKVLATHSLTGKSAPALPHKPLKLCLDPVRVQDIIVTVSKKCKVKENLVKKAITTKCINEYKMFRTREAKRKLKKAQKENCVPKNNRRTVNSSSSINSGSSS